MYFSTDGGVTAAKFYDAPISKGADIQGWASTAQPDPFDAFATLGTYSLMSSVDQQVMNALGWQSAVAPVPETSGVALAALGFGMVGVARRRRKPA